MSSDPLNGSSGANPNGSDEPDGKNAPLKCGYKWDPNRFLELFAENGDSPATARLLGISPSTVRQRKFTDPEFKRRFDECFLTQNEKLDASLLQLALDGQEEDDIREVASVSTVDEQKRPVVLRKHAKVGTKIKRFPSLMMFLAKNRMPEQYSDAAQAARVMGTDRDTDLPVDARTNFKHLTPDERAGFRAFMTGVQRLRQHEEPVETNGTGEE